MDCKKALPLLADYYEEKLDESKDKELQAHLETCPSCSKALSALKDIPILVQNISPDQLPKSLRNRIAKRASAAIKEHTMVAIEKPEQKGALRSYADAILKIATTMAAIVILLVSLVVLTHGFSFSTLKELFVPQQTSNPNTDVFKEEPAQSQNEEVRPESIEFLPRPEMPIEIGDYRKDTLEKVAIKYSVVTFAQNYRVIEAKEYQKLIISDMVKYLRKHGHETNSFKTSIKIALGAINKPGLPSYAEEVDKDGKDIWVIVINWEDGGQAAALSRISAFAIEPSTARIVDSWPKISQDIATAQQRVNPHKALYCIACHPNFDNKKKAFKKADWKATARYACIHCHNHKKQYDIYAKSIHGQLALAGKTGKNNKPAPTCADCHSGHSTLTQKDKPEALAAMRDKAQRICGGCHKDHWDSYDDYYHGKAYKAHAPDAPACWDCHGYHDIQPSKNRTSHVALINLRKTCRKCHSEADLEFVQYGIMVHERDKRSTIEIFWDTVGRILGWS